MKVVITSPSLDEDENVSGISTLVRNLIERRAFNYVHFEAGRKDADAADAGWIAGQIALPFRFFGTLRSAKPDVVHINTAFIPLAILRDTALAAAARLAKLPVLLHIHGGPFVMNDIKNPALDAAARHLLKMSAAAIVFSDSEARSLLKRYPGTKLYVLPNAIPTNEVPETERGSGERTIIFLGRLHESKGLKFIIEAIRMLKSQGFKFNYVCYGEGPEKVNFVAEMSTILGDKFSYRGVVKGSAKWQAFSEADIFFQPSRDEGLPLALLEAMASGCIPVMSASGAVADVIEDGRNGFLIEAGNTIETVGRLKMLLSESLNGWNELRQNARVTIREKFDFSKYVERLGKIYEETASGK